MTPMWIALLETALQLRGAAFRKPAVACSTPLGFHWPWKGQCRSGRRCRSRSRLFRWCRFRSYRQICRDHGGDGRLVRVRMWCFLGVTRAVMSRGALKALESALSLAMALGRLRMARGVGGQRTWAVPSLSKGWETRIHLLRMLHRLGGRWFTHMRFTHAVCTHSAAQES